MISSHSHHKTYQSGPTNPKQNVLQADLIRKMQILQGDEPCFATLKSHDCAELCQWRNNCRKRIAAWQRH